MGSSCSSGQAHKDKDSGSTRSEESPSYQVTHKVEGGLNSGVVLEVSSEARRQSAAPSTKPLTTLPHCLPSVSDTASPSSPAPGDKHSATTPLEEEDLRLLEFGRTTSKTPKIVLYICAADSQDCKVEKSVLHNDVYPGLREKCRDQGYELHIVDLHWTVQEKTPEPSELCLHELQRQSERGYVVPVVLLNSTLGSPQLPKTIECADFETAASDSSGLLDRWYRHDTHAQPPCYRLLPASHYIPGFKSDNKDEKDRAAEQWRAEVEKILTVMLATFSEELRDTYLSTVVEQEVQHTVLMSQEQAKRCLWLSRVFTHTQGQSTNPGASLDDRGGQGSPGESELRRRLQLLQKALKGELNESHIVRLQVKWAADGIDLKNLDHCHYLAQVVSTAERHLASVADGIIEEHNAKVSVKKAQGFPKWLLEEIGEQHKWAERCAQCSVNRQSILEQIQNWNGNGVVLVYGAEGCGKTTLASRLVQNFVQKTAAGHGTTRVIFRSANLTRPSGSLATLLLSIVLQARLLAATAVKPQSKSFEVSVVHNVSNYARILPEALEAASAGDRLVVIVDGIDQFREFSESTVDWVPSVLPNGVKVVVTMNEKSKLFVGLESRLRKENAEETLFIQMADLDKAEGESILLSSVMEYNHSVNSHVQDCVLASVQKCTLPLYVKVLAWQTSWCSEFDHRLQPMGDLQQQLSNMLADLELLLGRKLVEMCLCLLTAAKRGLTDSEMSDLLTSNPDFHTSTTYLPWAGACIFWSRVNKQLRPFLHCSGGGSASSCITWRDWSVRRAVERRYSERMPWAHRTLLAYFTGALWDDSSGIKARMISQPNKFLKSYNRRKLEEVPYQAFKCKGTCKEYLLDHEWLYDKICGSSVYEVLEDIELEGCKGSSDLIWLKSLLEDCTTALDYDGRQFYTQAARRQPMESSELSKKLMALASNPPVNSLIQLTSGCNVAPDPHEKHFDSLIRLPDNPWFVVTIRTEKETIMVWDIRKCEPVRTLKGVPQPMSLQMIDDFRCVVLCKRELRTYDLDNGTLLTKLKGMMNQKMPYYGLHDSRHLVALSRNRMYVNLMNLETGDLVTTFKAGEDRFLNSLLVSGDGRMLVCGDETQKPFPLLVWNLSSRKLLYDLRIPGHDFVTSLSAITHQGHYVCCVAKEVDEPSPNFIVVYDLQSGTLFKKWKPGVDCVAVDISSRDSCVVSGHADGSILVWDLVTGNCRWRLVGHTAPVSFLRLDPNASCCLSADTMARDHSVRIWDLSTGELSAVYTPDSPISVCEVTGGGRHIVLATLGHSSISCLELRGPNLQDIGGDHAAADDDHCYGQVSNRGRIFTPEDR